MKAIKIGSRYEIYDDSLQTFDQLPAGFYTIGFSKMSGFFLSVHHDIEVNEKVYGQHSAKVDKTLRSFGATKRNLGVILSGKKGIGKSLCAKLLSIRAAGAGYPVVFVDTYIPGIASYLESIEQECVVMFDEYDKTFGGVAREEGKSDAQTEMLSLFDGMAQGKKLFVITCNELRNLSDFLVNRPGRFHYHFRFNNPSEEEIREYLGDHVSEEYKDEIEKAVDFARRVDLNYDCLRAIATELNTGEPFASAIRDLNIVNTETPQYDVTLFFNNGTRLVEKRRNIDLFDPHGEVSIYMYDKDYDNVVDLNFDVQDCITDYRGVTVDGASLRLDFSEDADHADKVEALKKAGASHVLITRCRSKDIHYAL